MLPPTNNNASRIGLLRRRFRGWRRSRPFWGGFLLIISGLELLSIPLSGVLARGAIKFTIYIGIGGVFGVLLGVLLIAAGIVLWADPAHRVFYGVAGVVLGILSFPATNLGGFFLGMLIAIVGGSLAFAWTPLPADGAASDSGADGSHDDDAGPSDDDAGPSDEASPGGDESASSSGRHARGRRRGIALAALPILVLSGILTAGSHPANAATGAANAAASTAHVAGGNGCILWIICPPPSPSPSPKPTPSPTPTPTPTRTPSPTPHPTPSPTKTTPGTKQPKPHHRRHHKAKRKLASLPSGLSVSSSPAQITSGSATLSHFNYQGLVSMPVAGTGQHIEMMKFTANSIALGDGVVGSVHANGVTTFSRSATLDFQGNVVLYTTELSGCLDVLSVRTPICVDMTPGSIQTVLGQIAGYLSDVVPLKMSNVVTHQPLTSAGSLTAGSLSISFG